VPEQNSSNEVSDAQPALAVPPFSDIERPRSGAIREGLPSTYRMRADAHYVDHLDSRQPIGPDTWLDPNVIESSQPVDDGAVSELADSIRRHGILQPLLVQHRDNHYRVIAGHRRRRAAMLAGLRRVPCILHNVDDEEARALSAAANLRRPAVPEPASRPVDASPDVARSLETLSIYAGLLSGTASELSRGLSADLIAAEAWRALCVVQAGRIVQHGAAAGRKLVAPGGIVERVASSFWPECRLRNLSIEVEAQIPDGRSILVDERQLVVGLSGAVIATLAVFDRLERAALRLSASVGATGHASFVVSQTAVVVPDSWASRAFDQEWVDRPGGASALASMLALKRVADVSGATVTAAAGRRGTSITLTVAAA
jgi:hypothetical protein